MGILVLNGDTDPKYQTPTIIILSYSISIGRDCMYIDINSKVHEPKYGLVVIMYLLSDKGLLET